MQLRSTSFASSHGGAMKTAGNHIENLFLAYSQGYKVYQCGLLNVAENRSK
jgi:hypothetical protein